MASNNIQVECITVLKRVTGTNKQTGQKVSVFMPVRTCFSESDAESFKAIDSRNNPQLMYNDYRNVVNMADIPSDLIGQLGGKVGLAAAGDGVGVLPSNRIIIGKPRIDG